MATGSEPRGLDTAAVLLASAERILVLSGAGISTESGISDFRGPNGLWTRDPGAARMFDLAAYVADPELRRTAWRMRRDSEIRTAEPNAGHRALAAWESAQRSVIIATQNIDGLHQRAGSTGVLELHGTFWQALCLGCDRRTPIEEVFDRIDTGTDDPHCLECGGILRTATVAFGQQLDPAVLGAAVAAARSSDLTIAVGSSLIVQPAASLCDISVSSGAELVIVNAEPTPYDDLAAAVVRGAIGATLPQLTAALRPPTGTVAGHPPASHGPP